MKISSMTASFGRLERDSLELGPGLNIVQAPNESGKSTWCAFIRAMLYGVNSSERDKQGQLSVKTRYRPWSGGPMEGSMDILHEGREISLRRAAQGQYPMRSFSAVYTGTAERVSGLTGESAGERLTGVTQEVFERSAFIGQAAVAVSPGAELEKRMGSIVSSGSEEYSYTDADAELRRRMRRLRYNQRGSIPEAAAELERIREALAGTESLAAEYDRLKTELNAAREEKRRAEKDLEMYSRIDSREKTEKIFEAQRALLEAQKAEREAEQAAELDGRPVTRADAEKLRLLQRGRDACREALEGARREAEQARYSALERKNALAESPFRGAEPEKVLETCSSVRERYLALMNGAASGGAPLAAAIIALVLSVAGFALFAALSAGKLLGLAAGVVFLAVFVLLLVQRRRRNDSGQREKREALQLLSGFGVQSPEELEARARDYAEAYADMQAAEAALAGLDAALVQAQAAYDEAELKLRAAAMAAGAKDADEALTRIEASLSELSRRTAQREAAERLYNSLGEAFDRNRDFHPGTIVQPERSREECRRALERADRDIALLIERTAQISGRLMSMGDPVLLGTRISELEQQLESQTARYGALELASRVLAEANTEMQTRFSPELSRRASELMAQLTGGRYEKIAFDKKFEAEAKGSGEGVAHSALYLSAGTVDQLYLALRLALCELVLPAEEPCPIILDDALANFDDARMQRALELLCEMAKTRQIILFSCHEREGAYLSGRENVRVTSLA